MAEIVERVHATAISVRGRAVVIRGPSGSGKSDLALRCLARGTAALITEPARLVADDQVIISRQGATLSAAAPPNLFGKIEVRGMGILEITAEAAANVVLFADLVPLGQVERFLDPWPVAGCLGLGVPLLRIFAFEASAPEKLLAALINPNLPAISEAL